MQNCALVAAASWGFGIWGLGLAQFGNVESGPASAVALGVAAFVSGWAILAFFSALLLNVSLARLALAPARFLAWTLLLG